VDLKRQKYVADTGRALKYLMHNISKPAFDAQIFDESAKVWGALES
jgi:hypothetical protein